jgi:hypothetical protein
MTNEKGLINSGTIDFCEWSRLNGTIHYWAVQDLKISIQDTLWKLPLKHFFRDQIGTVLKVCSFKLHYSAMANLAPF